jgi:acetone carboxylase gamma subunit
VIKCDCGHEFCPHDENWKLEALIRVRDDVDALREIYPEKMHGDPEWNVLREYFCPGCKALLEVEAVAPGYPVVHDFLPDLEGFYEDWLGRPLPGAAA